MLWLLDTCIISELTKPEPNQAVQNWLRSNAKDSALAAVSVGELQYGVQRLASGARKRKLQIWLDGLCSQFDARVLSTTLEIWQEFGRLKSDLEQTGRIQDDLDVLIAATAHCHKLALVTRNVRHFADTGLEICDPWQVVEPL
jgi:toxin FitB